MRARDRDRNVGRHRTDGSCGSWLDARTSVTLGDAEAHGLRRPPWHARCCLVVVGACMTGSPSPLHILPFDHRASFEHGWFGWAGALSRQQTEQIAAAKQVVYAALWKATDVAEVLE
jgi:hypothetical protein